MSAWNAVPWDTIFIIVAIAILTIALLTITFIRIRRFEDLGLIVGVFLIALCLFSYFYIIPNEVIGQAMLPENYVWEDTGNVRYWERNSVYLKNNENKINENQLSYTALGPLLPKKSPINKNFTGREVIHAVSYDEANNRMLINDVIYSDDNKIFAVINENEKVSEWYYINPKLSSLKYSDVDAGVMGIPSNNKDIFNLSMGWVDSQGMKNGTENVVFVRDMIKIKSGVIDGLDVSVWQSDIYNKPMVWHGKPYFCDETLQLIVEQKTGYVIHVYRNLMLYAHISEFVKLYYPDALKHRIVARYLEVNDPIGEAAQLVYDTTDESQAAHISEVKTIGAMMFYVPLIICLPISLLGIALTWRYWGRSYYWKRYKAFEITDIENGNAKRKFPKKLFAVSVVLIIVFSSIAYVFFTNYGKETNISSKIPEINGGGGITPSTPPPTPPGTQRVIDSGRHILEASDEAPHRLSAREWWYFNAYFNDPMSELPGDSMIISFNRMAFNDIRFLKRDNHFLVLYDNKTNAAYDFSIFNKKKGTMKVNGPGVDVSFGNSYATGSYPRWFVHAESKEGDFVAELTYTATFMPVWVMGRSSNLAIFRHFGGDYYVPRCFVEGNVTWEGKTYFVAGIGYLDHVWQTTAPRFVTKGWDWLNLHFENGWEMYLSKFIFRIRGSAGYLGALVISPDNQNIIEYNIFQIKYKETDRIKGIPSLSYPTKFTVIAKRYDTILNLDVELINPVQIAFKLSRTGMIEGPIVAKGSFSWANYTVELNGNGFFEATRVKYIFQLPGIFSRISSKIFLNAWINRPAPPNR